MYSSSQIHCEVAIYDQQVEALGKEGSDIENEAGSCPEHVGCAWWVRWPT